MASLLYQAIEQISREKHIEPEIIVAAIEDAMAVAARKYYKTEEDMRSKFNPETGQVDVYAVRAVVDEVTDPKREVSLAEGRKINPAVEVGGEVLIARPTDVLGRIAAQTAKQVIMQKVREAERDTIFNEFNGRVGELVNCIVKRVEGPDVIVDLGRTEARLPKREQSRLETYNLGDRLRVVIRAVERASKGPQVIVSRADPMLVQRLFEMEVPEIYDGTVQIRAAAREAGERTKIAVQSRDKDVDPVGACVGMKGMRVQSIIRELRGEKIDIIPFNEDTVTFAQKALSPAKVTRVQIVDPETRHLEVIVEDTQLSLAIGKKGQNVRLASKLIGWNIDIKSEEEKRQEIEAQMAALTAPGTPLSELKGVGPKTIEKIEAHGISSIEKLADMTPEQLMEIPGIGEKMVEKIQQSVRSYFEAPEAQPAVSSEGAEAASSAAPAGDAELAEAPEQSAGEAGEESVEAAASVEEAQQQLAAEAGAEPSETAEPAEAASSAAPAGDAELAEAPEQSAGEAGEESVEAAASVEEAQQQLAAEAGAEPSETPREAAVEAAHDVHAADETAEPAEPRKEEE
ncbi:MAG: transcription termination/antitermination protein NusA [Acidobacteria bacterium]|nr:MAG: transcription termination/antitermination protein NusA [Acidobacteriota bacterium]